LIFMLLAYTGAMAADGEYAVSKIPQELLKNAHVIIRKEEQHIEMRNLEKMVLRNKYVITVLDEQGDQYAYLVEGYDKFTEIESIEGTLYDAAGRKIKSLKKSDIKDESATSEGSLAMDYRMKFHSFYHRVYPYTVEYESEVTKKRTMFFPAWNPVRAQHTAVEASNLEIVLPKDYIFRFKNYNCAAPVIEELSDKKKYKWNVANLPAIEKEYAGPYWHEIAPYIIMAPSEFQIEDYTGNMKDWIEFGKFQYSLNKGRDIVPDAIKQKVHQLIAGVESSEEKTKILYKYLQDNTRYISIQLGIGGWRPFDANYVATKAYGDCKALSNYMVALLKEANVPAYYALIRAGNGEADIITDFPSQQFNHVIVMVPVAKDSIWLECTSQTTPPGYMGGFTGNRHALIIDENGGKLVTTPHYSSTENLQLRNIEAQIDTEGNLKAVVRTKYKAMQQDDLHGLINALSKDKVMEFLKSEIDLPNYDVEKFEYKEQKEKVPSINETLQITGNNYAAVSGKRLFVTPNLLSKSHSKLLANETRKYDVRLSYEYKDIDTVVINLPKGYQAESIPKDVFILSKFGKYSCSVKFTDDKIIYYRSMEQYAGRFPAKEYSDMVAYFEQIYKADRSKVVLVRKD
jgi:hypothetical protein